MTGLAEFNDLFDDDDFISDMQEPLEEARKKTAFVVTVKVQAEIDPHVLEVLLHQYRSIKGVPATDVAISDMVEELRDIGSAISNYKENFLNDLHEIPTDEPRFSDTALSATMLGVKAVIEVEEHE